jgi:uncharacterized protein (TIGR03083 family)
MRRWWLILRKPNPRRNGPTSSGDPPNHWLGDEYPDETVSLRLMNPAGYLDVFRNLSIAMLKSAQANLEVPVPSCPGWTVAELIAHVGATWGWAAAIVRTGARDELPSSPEGAGGTELLEWAAEQSRQLFDALKDADPDSDCWTFGLPRSRLFWFRRQALETAVHAWDVQHAIGQPDPIDSDLATDGIDEFLAVMLPRHIQRQPDTWTGQSLHLHRTDGDGEWMIRLGPGASLSTERTHGQGDMALRGPASSLYLWCLNRLPSIDLELIGDGALADRWTAEVSF